MLISIPLWSRAASRSISKCLFPQRLERRPQLIRQLGGVLDVGKHQRNDSAGEFHLLPIVVPSASRNFLFRVLLMSTGINTNPINWVIPRRSARCPADMTPELKAITFQFARPQDACFLAGYVLVPGFSCPSTLCIYRKFMAARTTVEGCACRFAGFVGTAFQDAIQLRRIIKEFSCGACELDRGRR